MHKLLLTLTCIFLTTQVTAMEVPNQPSLENLPIEIATQFIAQCESKNNLRLTCTQLSKMASRRTNVSILEHPALSLCQEALDHYLLYYTALGKTDIVGNLLNRGANPNAREDSGISVLRYATQYGYHEIAKMLREHPALINTKNTLCSPLYFMHCLASQFSHEDVSKILSEHNFDTHQLLCYAATNGLYSLVQVLLERGVNPNPRNETYESPLKNATYNGHIGIMQLLLNKKAVITRECIQCTMYRGYTNALQLLLDYDATDVNIWLDKPIEKNYINTIKLILKHGANVNRKNPPGLLNYENTPLHCASSSNRTRIISIFLAHGANIDEENERGETPLHLAVEAGHLKAVNFLIARGANINKMTKSYGNTPLDFAKKYKRHDIEKILIEHQGKTKDEQSENCTIQ